MHRVAFAFAAAAVGSDVARRARQVTTTSIARPAVFTTFDGDKASFHVTATLLSRNLELRAKGVNLTVDDILRDVESAFDDLLVQQYDGVVIEALDKPLVQIANTSSSHSGRTLVIPIKER
jgi:hypothetical protein